MKDMVTKAHHRCWEDLQQVLIMNSNARIKFFKIHKEMSLMSVLTLKDSVRELAADGGYKSSERRY